MRAIISHYEDDGGHTKITNCISLTSHQPRLSLNEVRMGFAADESWFVVNNCNNIFSLSWDNDNISSKLNNQSVNSSGPSVIK